MKVFHESLPVELVLVATNSMAEVLDDDAATWHEQHALLIAMLRECLALGADRLELNWDARHHLDCYVSAGLLDGHHGVS
ncbi:hypothetical protein [Azospirillum sp. B510]|uniref:hypothetical protein n=1 Tax=Azospirillum sp. (strain B510) TaxID=137722 RepID=UPI00030FA7ED|nr:hypothetical protein [Azospirillum sp. B510]